MKRKGLKCTVVCSLVLIAVGGCHRIDENEVSTCISDGKELRAVPANDRQIGSPQEQEPQVLEPVPAADQDIDNLWRLFPGEPQRSFRRSREDLLAEKYRIAAQTLQKSTLYVKLQSLRAFGPSKSALLDSESALRKLTKDVEDGKMNSLARLDTTFAATHRAISRLHLDKAKEAYAQGELAIAGVELQAAKDSLGRAAVWTGDHVDPVLTYCSDRAGEVAMRLIEGSDGAPANTRKALSDLGAQLDRLDKKSEVEDTRDLFVGEAEFHLKQAQSSFENRDREGAAADIRRAGACMAVEAFGSFGDAKGVLDKEIEALGKTAEEVKNGSLRSSNKLQRRFASAQYALARVHYVRASRYDAQHYYKKTVAALGAAVTNLECAVAWAGEGMKNSSARTVKDVKDMSRRMREGLSVKPEEISGAVSNLKKAIGRLETLAASP